MGKLVQRYVKSEAGGLTAIFALTAPVIAGAIALGIDAGRAELAHKEALHAAEAAAVSASVAFLANNNNDINLEATNIAAKYGFTAASQSTITVNRPPLSGPYAGNTGAVEVIITQPQPSHFATLVWPGLLTVTGRAVAMGGDKACIIALDPTASGAVGEQGSVTAAAQNCSVYSNSSDSSSVSVGGSATLSALTVNAVGSVYGTSSITTQAGIYTNQLPIRDPYASVNMPSYSGCNQTNVSYKNTVTIYPGVYCKGMTLNAGAVVTLSPGVYVFDQGQLKINGGATFQGSGVTLVFTSSTGNNNSWATANINGGAVVNLTPQTSGPYAGIVFYGDRAMPVGTTFGLGGGAYQYIGGAIYLPKGAVSYYGNAGTNANCTQIVGDTITFVGNSTLGLSCPYSGVRYSGAPRILE
jgi:hypothetical protein